MPSTQQHQSRQMLAVAAAACEDKKAEDIRILALDPTESGLTDYFLICTGMSDRQNVAITDEIEIRLKREFGVYPNSVEGRRQGEWVLMDYVDFIVHVFSVEKRAYYGLERLRKTATSLTIADLNAQLKQKITAAVTPGRKLSTVAKKSAAKKTSVKKAIPVRKAVAKKPAATQPAKKSPPVMPAKKSPAKKTAVKSVKKTTPAKKTAKKSPKKATK